MIIVIAIAVLVLVVIAAFFSGSFLRGSDTIKYQSALSNSCTLWRQGNCDGNFQVRIDSNSGPISIGQACSKAYPEAAVAIDQCYQLCGCPSPPAPGPRQ